MKEHISIVMIFAWLYWNPDRFIFTLPIIDRPIAWYGFFFVLGFIIGYFMIINMIFKALKHTQYIAERDIVDWKALTQMLQSRDHLFFSPKINADINENLTKNDKNLIIQSINDRLSEPDTSYNRQNIDHFFPKAIYSLKDLAILFTDKLTWFIVAGTIIGARLGHVFLYDWPRYKNHPLDIIKIWEGGLASHGGTIGVFLAILLFYRYTKAKFPEIRFLNLLDFVCIPTALVCFFIRIGNFFNQEILGTASTLPWAIIFGDPVDGSGIYPRHPVQLYEAACYLATFFILLWVHYKREHIKPGFITGLFFFLVFGSRFLIEYLKVPMGLVIDESILQTGQLLSIPFIAIGLGLMLYRTPFKN